MMCVRDRTFWTAACRCSRCDLRLDEAVHRAAATRSDGQRGPVPLSIADRSAGCPDFAPDIRA